MKLFVGLGNPGKEYEMTRHNAGFTVLDDLASKWHLSFDQEKFNATFAKTKINDETIILLKPLTYMNNSGEAVQRFMQFYKLNREDIIVVHDDLDLPVGKLRIREKGSSGGQKGMGSIIELCGGSDIKRIRVGIGKSAIIPVVDYVLGKIPDEDKELFIDSVHRASDALDYAATHSFAATMNKFNI